MSWYRPEFNLLNDGCWELNQGHSGVESALWYHVIRKIDRKQLKNSHNDRYFSLGMEVGLDKPTLQLGYKCAFFPCQWWRIYKKGIGRGVLYYVSIYSFSLFKPSSFNRTQMQRSYLFETSVMFLFFCWDQSPDGCAQTNWFV